MAFKVADQLFRSPLASWLMRSEDKLLLVELIDYYSVYFLAIRVLFLAVCCVLVLPRENFTGFFEIFFLVEIWAHYFSSDLVKLCLAGALISSTTFLFFLVLASPGSFLSFISSLVISGSLGVLTLVMELTSDYSYFYFKYSSKLKQSLPVPPLVSATDSYPFFTGFVVCGSGLNFSIGVFFTDTAFFFSRGGFSFSSTSTAMLNVKADLNI